MKGKVRHIRQERSGIFQDRQNDPYQTEKKYPEPTVCIRCGASYQNGRWTWHPAPENSHETICPACQRIADDYPEGNIHLSGKFFLDHRHEIMNLVRNIEKDENKRHPMERIMKKENKVEETEIATTGMHLARRIADGIKDAYKGELEYSYKGETHIRIIWHR